eukprot:COSAG02_NODE_38141_length_432_cov_32.450450_1_plen_79_part_01
MQLSLLSLTRLPEPHLSIGVFDDGHVNATLSLSLSLIKIPTNRFGPFDCQSEIPTFCPARAPRGGARQARGGHAGAVVA